VTDPEPADEGLAARLRMALTAAEFTYGDDTDHRLVSVTDPQRLAAVLGTTGHTPLSRNETLPGQRATRGGTPSRR
jgi:hypothetical protein